MFVTKTDLHMKDDYGEEASISPDKGSSTVNPKPTEASEPEREEDIDQEAGSDEEPESKIRLYLVTRKDELPKRKEVKLKRSEISQSLSYLGKTADGEGYTYLKATCIGMGLTNINAIKSFKHLQLIDFSNNELTLSDLNAITALPFLVFLQANGNKLTSAALKPCKYLQVLIVNQNQIKTIKDVYQPELSTLEAANNEIEEIRCDSKMDKLRILDLNHNKITEIASINFPNLDSLYLAYNKIESLVGLEMLPNLRVLHVRNNPIRFLDGFTPNLTKLEYINLRSTKILTLRQIRKLQCLPSLNTLQLKGTPFFGGPGPEEEAPAEEEEDPELRIEVLATLQRLVRLNKLLVSEEEREEARKQFIAWREEGEKEEDEELLEEDKVDYEEND